MSESGRILVTGASGFVGSALLQRLLTDCKYELLGLVSRAHAEAAAGVNLVNLRWSSSANIDFPLAGVRTVVHAAARVHRCDAAITAEQALHAYREVNLDFTLELARQAAASGVTRFVFLSTVKVNGEATLAGLPLVAESAADPVEPYAVSKWEAEQGLRAIAGQTGMELVIIRPVLVYGPGVGGNFQTMMTWLLQGLPLPLAAINNKRSLVALDNLVDLIATCIEHPAAANRTFFVSDGDDLSTPELLRRLACYLGRPARLWPLPSCFIGLAARLLGQPGLAQRLCQSLQVDISETRKLLDWQPVRTVDAALSETAQHFLANRRNAGADRPA